jgi:hypothetical protein
MLETEEFSSNDLTILRAYEWERINFTDPFKTKKIAERMGVSIDELDSIRRRTRENARKQISDRTYPAVS